MGDEKLKEKARIELNETDDIRDVSIEKVKNHESLKSVSEKHQVCFENQFLLKFLRARKFDIKRTADLISNYYEKKNLLCGIDKLRDSVNFENEIRHLSENFGDFIAVLDKPDSCGRRVIICRENVIKTSATADENRPYTLWFFILLEWLLDVDEQMQVNGVVVISDMSSFSYSHLQWLMTHPAALKERVTSIQDAVPMRIKAIRVANEPFIFTMVYALVSPFLKAKLRDRLKTVSTRYEEIYKIIGEDEEANLKQTLPNSIGGKLNFESMAKETAQRVCQFYLARGSIF